LFGGGYVIARVNGNAVLAYAHPSDGGYQISSQQSFDTPEVATVKSLFDVGPALLDYNRKHPPQWEPESATSYLKVTEFADLWVRQDQTGAWTPYRGGNSGDYPLLRNGKPISFLNLQDAQLVAELHHRDCYPHAARIDDGYFWPLDPDARQYFELRGELPEIDSAAAQQTRLWFPHAAGALHLAGSAVVLFAT
jgi:hypothetical protein